MAFDTSKISTSVLRVLHRLQRQLTDLRERLDRGPRQIHAAEANIRRCEEEAAKTKEEAKTMRLAADKKQLQLKANEDKVKDLRNKLNTATNNREYQILREQIAADEMANSVLADEILEAFEKADDFQKNIADAEQILAAAKKKTEEIHADVARVEPTLRADLGRIEAELQTHEATLPNDLGELYNRIVRSRGEDALAVVEGQCCGGCHQQLPLNHCANVMLGKPVLCKSCGRLLYLPEGEERKAKEEEEEE
jgi:predicted  nucleic acid-binding Zn-ribbon protein